MKTFNMYVKTLIPNEKGKILLLKQKTMDKKPRWDLPGVPLTEDESFDEVVTKSIQKVIGYYVYPGKILGVNDFITKDTKEVYVIMEANILNGEILLNNHYEDYAWVNIDRIHEYPLVDWFNNYMKKNKFPFEDVSIEINEINQRQNKRNEIIQEDISNNIYATTDYSTKEDSHIGESVKNSFGLLKNTIKRTFHPKQASARKTEPKENIIYQKEEETNPLGKINIPEIDTQEEEITTISTEKPEIRKIRENNRPYIRKVKESSEKISFNTNINASNWKEKLNNINKTSANKEKKQAPIPKNKKE